jgi:CheY-like chemotaxis protein
VETTVPESTVAAPAGSGRRILIVDDNVDAAVSLAMLLSVGGYECRPVHDGQTALSVAPQLNPDVFLLDIGMPGMSGYELARRLRALPQFRRTLLIAVTGWGKEEDRQQSREAGFDHHLVKPVSASALLELIGQC